MQWRIQGAMVRRPPWSDHDFFDNFCTIFVRFLILRLNCKIRVTVFQNFRVFCLLKTVAKCTQTYHFGEKKIIFFWGGAQPPPPHSAPLDANGASPPPLLTEILNMPLNTCIYKN